MANRWYIQPPRHVTVTSHSETRRDVLPAGTSLDWRRASKRGSVRGL